MIKQLINKMTMIWYAMNEWYNPSVSLEYMRFSDIKYKVDEQIEKQVKDDSAIYFVYFN